MSVSWLFLLIKSVFLINKKKVFIIGQIKAWWASVWFGIIRKKTTELPNFNFV